MIFVSTEKFLIQLQAAWRLTSNLSTVIMTLVDLYLPVEDSGIAFITFLMGQMFICPNLKNIKLTHVINILHIVDADTLNNWAKWSSRNLCLSLRMTIKKFIKGP